MKKLNVIFSVLSAVLIMFFASCGDGKTQNKEEDNDSNTNNTVEATVIGSWIVVKGEGFAADGEVGSKYIFAEDGTFTMGEGADVLTTTYEIKDGKLVTASSVEGEFYFWDYEVTDKTLHMWGSEKDQDLMLEKN